VHRLWLRSADSPSVLLSLSTSERSRHCLVTVALDYFLVVLNEIQLFEPFSACTLVAVQGFGNDVPRRAQNAAVSHTHTLTPMASPGFIRFHTAIGAP